MSATLTLFGHSLRRMRSVVLAMTAILAAFQILLALAGSALQETGMFGQIAAIIPPFVRQIVGPSIAAVMSYAGVAAIGYFHVAVTAAIVGLAVAIGTEPAAEVESGFADLLLARPVPRRAVILRSVVVLLVGLTLVVAAMVSGTWAGATFIAPESARRPEPALVVSLAVNLWALGLAWGGIALAIASASRRRIVAGAVTGLAALILFLLDYLGRIWPPADPAARLSPFRYCSGLDLVAGKDLPAEHLVVLLGIALAGWAVALAVYGERDI